MDGQICRNIYSAIKSAGKTENGSICCESQCQSTNEVGWTGKGGIGERGKERLVTVG